jgi:hypothetical protein
MYCCTGNLGRNDGGGKTTTTQGYVVNWALGYPILLAQNPACQPACLPATPVQMGLGKTAQSISVLAFQHQFMHVRGPFLVVAPLTTLGHWQREIETWTDMVRVCRFALCGLCMLCVLCCLAAQLAFGF